MRHKTLIMTWLLNLLLVISTVSFANKPLYVWKTNGTNTYSDIPPTIGHHYTEVKDENIATIQKQINPSNDNIQTYSQTINSNSDTTTPTISTKNSEDKENCEQAKKNLSLVKDVPNLSPKDQNTLTDLYQKTINKYCY